MQTQGGKTLLLLQACPSMPNTALECHHLHAKKKPRNSAVPSILAKAIGPGNATSDSMADFSNPRQPKGKFIARTLNNATSSERYSESRSAEVSSEAEATNTKTSDRSVVPPKSSGRKTDQAAVIYLSNSCRHCKRRRKQPCTSCVSLGFD